VVSSVGRNGAGKSTLLKSIAGFVKNCSGEVTCDGAGLLGLRSYDIAKMGIKYIPQDKKVFSDLTVRESAFLASMLPGPKVYDPYRKLDRVVRRSDRILKRMFAARMITEEEYKGALAEAPNIAGLERKVEKTMESTPPEEKPPVALPESGPGVLDPGPVEAPVAAPREGRGEPEPRPDEGGTGTIVQERSPGPPR